MLSYIVGVLLCGILIQTTDLSKNDPLNALLKMADQIESDSSAARSALQGKTLRDATPPTLSELGRVKVGMRESEVLAVLSTPLQKSDSDSGQRWVYSHSKGSVLTVVFDQTGVVNHIASDASDVIIPDRLRAGLLLEQFERVYGGQEVRKSTRLGVDRRLIEYPLSHLALIVSSEGNRVESLMVFK